jgi:CelD/BcsL family acetyltransferase involved in cellulose biosynthesis
MSSLNIRVFRSFDEFPRSAWDRLYHASPDASIFQCYDWNHAWWSTCASADAELHIVVVEKGARIIGIAPHYLGPGTRRETLSLRILGGSHNDYQTYLVDPAVMEGYRALFDYLSTRTDLVDIELREIPRDSLMSEGLSASHLRLIHEDSTPCPKLVLNDEEIYRLEHKKSSRRIMNRLRRLGDLTVTHDQQSHEILKGLPDFFSQHIERWADTQWPSPFRQAQNRNFYEQLAKRLPAGSIVLTRLEIENTLVSCHLGFRSGEDFLWYKPAFNLKLSRYSPGLALVLELARFAAGSGFRALDFTRGGEAFKYRFANHVSWNDNVHLFPGYGHYMRALGHRTAVRAYRRVRYGDSTRA